MIKDFETYDDKRSEVILRRRRIPFSTIIEENSDLYDHLTNKYRGTYVTNQVDKREPDGNGGLRIEGSVVIEEVIEVIKPGRP